MAKRRAPKPSGYHWDQKDPIPRDDGLPPCRWCKGPCHPPKKSWCGSPECVRQWRIRTNHRTFRAAVFERDRGICASCGLDTNQYDVGLLKRLIEHELSRPYLHICDRRAHEERIQRLRTSLEDAYAWIRINAAESAVWEIDHVKPIADGGDYFDMRNISSLCPICHKIKTQEENIARSKKKSRKSSGRRKSRC